MARSASRVALPVSISFHYLDWNISLTLTFRDSPLMPMNSSSLSKNSSLSSLAGFPPAKVTVFTSVPP